MKTIGINTILKNEIIGAKANTNFSALLLARVLGVISPKIRIINVTNPVARATPIPSFPNIEITKDVVNDDAAILTRLLPTRIVDKSCSLLSRSFCTSCARRLFSSSAKVLILILDTAINDVSADEKNAESIINIKKATIIMV